ncbi:MAG: hypothetical protein QM736_02920 [Vicinamibacterales bacterium]
MYVGEHRAPLLDVRRIALQHLRGDERVELVPLHARHRQQPAVGIVEPIERATDRPAHRLRQFARNRPRAAAQRPPSVDLRNRPDIAQIANDVDHEERVPLGAIVQQRDEVRGERVSGIFERQVAFDVCARENLENDLDEHAVAAQALRDLEERMPRDRHVRRAIGGEHQQPHPLHAAREIVQQNESSTRRPSADPR